MYLLGTRELYNVYFAESHIHNTYQTIGMQASCLSTTHTVTYNFLVVLVTLIDSCMVAVPALLNVFPSNILGIGGCLPISPIATEA